MFVWKNEVYITGSRSAAAPPEGTFEEICTYSLRTQTWTRHTVGGEIPPFTDRPGWCWTGKYLFMFGGMEWKERKPLGDYPNDLYKYDPEENKWSKEDCSNRPSGRDRGRLFFDGVSLYLFGGWTRQTRPEDLWRLDLTSKVWERADLGSPQSKFEIWPLDQIAGSVWTGKELLVFGCSWKGGLDNVWTFNPAQKSWRKLPVPSERPTHRVAAAFLAPSPAAIYMFGGLTTVPRRSLYSQSVFEESHG
jgi:hypothetical protein